jgi:hypothetical protein
LIFIVLLRDIGSVVVKKAAVSQPRWKGAACQLDFLVYPRADFTQMPSAAGDNYITECGHIEERRARRSSSRGTGPGGFAGDLRAFESSSANRKLGELTEKRQVIDSNSYYLLVG